MMSILKKKKYQNQNQETHNIVQQKLKREIY